MNSSSLQLLNDQNSEVRLNVISNLEEGNTVRDLLAIPSLRVFSPFLFTKHTGDRDRALIPVPLARNRALSRGQTMASAPRYHRIHSVAGRSVGTGLF